MLEKEEIQQIYTFVKSRGVQHLDVQHEIVDHVATAIEEKRQQHPDLSVEEGIRQVHQSFGIKGFSVFTEACQKKLQKQLWVDIKHEWNSFFSRPVKLLLTPLFCLLLWQVMQMTSINWRTYIAFAAAGAPVVFMAYFYFAKTSIKGFKLKNYLVTMMPLAVLANGYFVLVFNVSNVLLLNEQRGLFYLPEKPLVLALAMTLHCVLSLIFLKIIYKSLDKALKLHRLYAS